jgi:hypothetical protein
MSQRSSVELLEYAGLTLQLIERLPYREEDAHLARELEFACAASCENINDRPG